MQFSTLTILLVSLVLTHNSYAQQLSIKDKIVKVEELPEYIVINCDNTTPVLTRPKQIEIQSEKSENEKILKVLQEILDNKKYLQILTPTDLLNTMSKLGYDYMNAFPQDPIFGSSFGRTGFVFRKKEKFRNIN